MVIDTSAVLAIMLRETLAERLIAAVDADHTRLVSAATVVEVTLVILGRFGEAGEPNRSTAEEHRGEGRAG